MSEEKKSRTVEEIRQEYSGLCAKAGHIQYQVAVMNEDLNTLNNQLKDLNFEAAKAAQSQSRDASQAVQDLARAAEGGVSQ